MTISHWPIGKLVPYDRNPRKHDQAVDRMIASIQEFGFKVPILARSNGEVVDGHLRLKAARKLGLTDLPVVLCDEWSEAQVKAFHLMVNRSVTWADWDAELVATEIKDLQALDFDLNLTGFDPVEIDGCLFGDEVDPAEQDVPEPCQDAITQTGDLWLCGPHRILASMAETVSLREFLEEVEKRLILRALTSSDGVQAEAARRLQLSRSDLAYKLSKYEIKADRE